jgi:proteic killer suppression protein
MMTAVTVSRFAEKQLSKIPKNIAEALRYWVEAVEREGILEIRKLKGYHDEPLKGNRIGQRTIRLNKAYRAIYVETNKNLEILVIEVNKHEY